MMKRNLTKVHQLHQTLPRTSQESGLLVNYSYHYKMGSPFKEQEHEAAEGDCTGQSASRPSNTVATKAWLQEEPQN